MASFEGPAPSGADFFGGPAPSLMTDTPAEPEVPHLTPERAQQELTRLNAIVKDNPSLQFLEPRVAKCMSDGVTELATFLSFYRLVSQSLSEELVNQKERIKNMEADVLKARQVSAQSQMDAALAEASQAVNRVAAGPSAPVQESQGAARAEHGAQVDDLLKKLEQAETQRERLLQDMQNMRNRAKTDMDVKVFKAVEKFTLSLLPALDAFHQAMPSLQNATDVASIVTGIEMIHDQLQNALVQAGLQRMIVVGQRFDPRLHESIGDVETWDVPDDHVYDELQPGYLFGERMVRAAIVRIARNVGTPPAPAAPEPIAQTVAPPAPEAAAPPAPPTPPAPEPVAEIAAPPAPPTPPAPEPVAEIAAPPAPPTPPAPEPVAEIAAPPAPPTPPAPEPVAEVAAPPAPPAPPAPEPVAEIAAPPAPPAPPAPEPVAEIAEPPAPPAPPAPEPVAEIAASPAPPAPPAPEPVAEIAASPAPPAPEPVAEAAAPPMAPPAPETPPEIASSTPPAEATHEAPESTPPAGSEGDATVAPQ